MCVWSLCWIGDVSGWEEVVFGNVVDFCRCGEVQDWSLCGSRWFWFFCGIGGCGGSLCIDRESFGRGSWGVELRSFGWLFLAIECCVTEVTWGGVMIKVISDG
ncbi:hypothetical protein M758_3G220500 [Ceratodon purpureus]|nr:hypothetical protein M758_3G220500 [Ceratodon purpureus]